MPEMFPKDKHVFGMIQDQVTPLRDEIRLLRAEIARLRANLYKPPLAPEYSD